MNQFIVHFLPRKNSLFKTIKCTSQFHSHQKRLIFITHPPLSRHSTVYSHPEPSWLPDLISTALWGSFLLCLAQWTLMMLLLSQLTCCMSIPNMARFIKLDEMPCGKKWLDCLSFKKSVFVWCKKKQKTFLLAKRNFYTKLPQGSSTQWTLTDHR